MLILAITRVLVEIGEGAGCMLRLIYDLAILATRCRQKAMMYVMTEQCNRDCEGISRERNPGELLHLCQVKLGRNSSAENPNCCNGNQNYLGSAQCPTKRAKLC